MDALLVHQLPGGPKFEKKDGVEPHKKKKPKEYEDGWASSKRHFFLCQRGSFWFMFHLNPIGFFMIYDIKGAFFGKSVSAESILETFHMDFDFKSKCIHMFLIDDSSGSHQRQKMVQDFEILTT